MLRQRNEEGLVRCWEGDDPVESPSLPSADKHARLGKSLVLHQFSSPFFRCQQSTRYIRKQIAHNQKCLHIHGKVIKDVSR